MNISRIPNHPATCRGVTGTPYDTNQCRLCWLAAYSPKYRRLWNVETPRLSKTQEELYACIHRGTNKVPVPGCSTCGGIPLAYNCNNQCSGASRCLVSGSDRQEHTARAAGFLVCKDCGWREPEAGLEMLLSEFRTKLEMPVGILPDGWRNWRVAYHGVRDAMRELASQTHVPQKNLKGRGIVIGAGGPKYFSCAFANVIALRELGCSLPIQFWYLGWREMDNSMLDICKEFGIVAVDATAIKTRILGGWELKPLATQQSKFEEVMYLDADCLPVVDPTFLFDTPEYQNCGAMFWRDIEHAEKHPCNVSGQVMDRAGLIPKDDTNFESGVYLVNKKRCYKELTITCWMNDHSDYWYKFLYGDKDTFRIAWELCERNYAFSPPPVWKSPCIIQHAPDGTPLFHHACQGKQCLVSGNPWSHYPHPEYIRKAYKILEERVRVLTRYGGETTMLANRCRGPGPALPVV